MTFNSLQYLIFLPIVFLAFNAVADRYRWLSLLIASYIFYGFLLKPALLIVLTAVILITFFLGGVLDKSQDGLKRKKILFLGVFANLSFLIYFKYLTFIIDNLNLLLRLAYSNLALNMPSPLVSIALSFFIFQAISYLADIYFRMAKPEPHLGYFALYISFFPKLLQGPIERSGTLLPQLKVPYEFNYDNTRSGMLLFAWGLFKKVAVADRLALFVNPVYNDVHAYAGLSLIIATYAYALQIYFDFAGYTDMARGTARLFGINLTENFNSPYIATSCSDFWRRWHISFSRWILDYVFEPLQMKFRNSGKNGAALALLCTFILAGIWHGASWCFVIFGLLHGTYLAASTYYRPYQKKLYKWLGITKSGWIKVWQIFATFNLVSFAFIFFRAASVSDAWYVVKNIVNFYSSYAILHKKGLHDFIRDNILMYNDRFDSVIIFAILLIIYFIYKHKNTNIFSKPVWFRWIMYNMIVMAIIFLGVSKSDFIYLKF